MTVEEQLLREAATLMHERADKATPGPWSPVEGIFQEETFAAVLGAGGDPQMPDTWIVATGRRAPGSISQQNDADHIASMHPMVAHAVAAWLVLEAGQCGVRGGADRIGHTAYALAVARAYLGVTE